MVRGDLDICLACVEQGGSIRRHAENVADWPVDYESGGSARSEPPLRHARGTYAGEGLQANLTFGPPWTSPRALWWRVRIVRAKRAFREARIPLELLAGEELYGCPASVLEVICRIFSEEYAAMSGDDWFRPGLCREAIRLGRILARLVPEQAEVRGLVSLMEIQASRLPARLGPAGEPVLLLDQDRIRWDPLRIRGDGPR